MISIWNKWEDNTTDPIDIERIKLNIMVIITSVTSM